MVPDIHELMYEGLMKRKNILKKLYLPDLAMNRYSSGVKQTAALIRGKVKKGEMRAVQQIDSTMKKELNDG